MSLASSSSLSSSASGLAALLDQVVANVQATIVKLGDRGGSSMARIKQALGADADELAFVAAALKRGTAKGVFARVGNKWKIRTAPAPDVEIVGHESLEERLRVGAEDAVVVDDELPNIITIGAIDSVTEIGHGGAGGNNATSNAPKSHGTSVPPLESAAASSSSVQSSAGSMGSEAQSWYEEGVDVYLGSGCNKSSNEERGRQLIMSAANAGCEMAKADCHYHGWSVFAKDTKKAFMMWKKIAEETGHALAESMVGNCLSDGIGVEPDRTKALEWYNKAAKKGESGAMNALGFHNLSGEILEQNPTRAVEWYSKAADKGNREAMNNLGNCFHEGDGIAKSFTQAAKWFTKAAEKGT